MTIAMAKFTTGLIHSTLSIMMTSIISNFVRKSRRVKIDDRSNGLPD